MKLPKSKLVWIAGIVAVVLGIAIAIFFATTQSSKPNYAEETAKPIEQALVKAGAVKKCSRGDGGYGPDNSSPNYTATFETNLATDVAGSLVQEIAAQHGYDLTEANSSYETIHNYSDRTSVASTFEQLQSGQIMLSVSLYDGGNNLSCANEKVEYDKNHTAIKIDITLPSFK